MRQAEAHSLFENNLLVKNRANSFDNSTVGPHGQILPDGNLGWSGIFALALVMKKVRIECGMLVSDRVHADDIPTKLSRHHSRERCAILWDVGLHGAGMLATDESTLQRVSHIELRHCGTRMQQGSTRHLTVGCLFCSDREGNTPCDPTCSDQYIDSFVSDSFTQNLYWMANAEGGITDTFPGACLDCSNESLAHWRALGFDESSVVADPLFVDVARYDFRLRSDSPALALGICSVNVSLCGPSW
eukprot:SAG11_NODE_6228_length_1358_cov_1.957903_2_plen_245_part_00